MGVGGSCWGRTMTEVGITSASASTGSSMLRLQVVLSHYQILLAGGYRALRADDLDRGHGPDLGLTPGVIERFLAIGQRLLLHAHVFVGVDQIPVHVLDLIDRGDDLQAKSHVGNLAVVFGDANEAHVGQESKALKQVLSEAELEG